MKSPFRLREDGYLQWDTGSLTFLIGSTNEDIPHMALWVTTISTLNYRMLESEAGAMHVKSRVIGGKEFIEYINKRQEVMDGVMDMGSKQKMIVI